MKAWLTLLLLALLPLPLSAQSVSAASAPVAVRVIPADTVAPTFDVAPLAIADSCPQPHYPDSLVIAVLQNPDSTLRTTELRYKVYVDEAGRVGMWKLLTTDPLPPALPMAVQKVLPLWKFRPATKAGEPIGAWTDVTFTFPPAMSPAPKP